MNDLPRQKLCELIARYGESVCDEHLRLEGLMRDFCPGHRRDVNVLVIALKERVATDLRNSSTATPIEVLLGRLTKRMEDQHATTPEMSRWAVESWALALGKISEAQLSRPKSAAKAAPPPRPPPRERSKPVAAPSPIYPAAFPADVAISHAVSRRKRSAWKIIVPIILLAATATAVFYAVRWREQLASESVPTPTPSTPSSVSPSPPEKAASVAPSANLVDLSSVPSGAKVIQGGVLIGTTPMQRNDLPPGETTFVLVAQGYLPRELKVTLDPKQPFKQNVSLVQPAPIYAGKITSTATPLSFTLASDLTSGTMTQSSRRGDTVVKFTGVWDGTTLRAVTGEVVSKPADVSWEPEGFTLHFADDGKSGSYECVANGKTYTAALSAQSPAVATVGPVYKGTIDKYGKSPVPLTINLAADRKSGTMTQTSKYGDVVIRFNGFWDGSTLRAVTDEVISKPKNIQWKPESFTVSFSGDGRSGSYECNSEGHMYSAQLSPP